jgi:hypothetical protein
LEGDVAQTVREPSFGVRLDFEGRYVLETEPCPRCDASGVVSRTTARFSSSCWNCRGTGRRPTPRARELYYLICEALGRPIEATGRFEPKHLHMIYGRELLAGMRVKPLRRPHLGMRTIAKVTWGADRSHLALAFEGGQYYAASSIESFARELTAPEIEAVQ